MFLQCCTVIVTQIKLTVVVDVYIFFDKSRFQMTVKSNYAIATAAPCDWLKILAPVFQQERSKTKTHRTLCLQFAPRIEEVMGNCYEF